MSGKDFSLTIFQYPADGRIQRVDKGEKLTLVFRVCELDDTGTYSVEITEFVKNGEKDQINDIEDTVSDDAMKKKKRDVLVDKTRGFVKYKRATKIYRDAELVYNFVQ